MLSSWISLKPWIALIMNGLSAKFNKPFVISPIFTLEEIYSWVNFEEKHCFKPERKRKSWCWCYDQSRLLLLQNSREKNYPLYRFSYFSVALFFDFFFAGSVSLSTMVVYLCGSLMVLTPTGKMRTLANSRLFPWNWGLHWKEDRLHACEKCDLAKSRFQFGRRSHAKNSLFTELISQKHFLFNDPTQEIISR